MAHPEYELYRTIIEEILSAGSGLDRHSVNRIKNRVCARLGVEKVPSNADIMTAAVPEELEVLQPLLVKRPVRTASGVAVVAVMTAPQKCPHGRCVYCPGGPEEGVPQSYTGYEPAAMRGLEHDFDPYLQVSNRLHQLRTLGHSVQKVELIVMGGDWCSKERDYRVAFVKGCLDALNGSTSTTVAEAIRTNETAPVRNVGMTFETRPDYVTPDSIDEMLELGATRVELGVQSLSDEILETMKRGHGVDATVSAIKLLRDSGLKVCLHMMPGLPGSSPERDLEDFDTLFRDPRFRPDMLKIYPTVVIEGTELYEWWKSGRYVPYTTDEIVELVGTAVSRMPEYVRIQRMQRDIPLHRIEAGLDKGNLRELVQQWMQQRGLRNPTIRYREVGHFRMRSDEPLDEERIRLVRRDYEAADGREVFLSFEDPELDVLFAFLRLRWPSEDAHRREIRQVPCMVIRELRVYGPAVNLGERRDGAWQHTGMGERLLEAAEEIAGSAGASRVLVNSGIGVREYYRKHGYVSIGPYLAKDIG